MRIVIEPLFFEWDKGNLEKNLTKHSVSSQEAEEVFNNRPLITIQDQKHSTSEIRFVGLGQTNQKRKLFLSFTIRGSKLRIISVRDMSRKEVKIYEKA